MRCLKAFTLVELLLVLAIVAAAASLSIPSFAAFYRETRLRGAANDLLYTLRYAHNRAVVQNRTVAVNFDAGFRGYWLSDDNMAGVARRLEGRIGRVKAMPDGIVLRPAEHVVRFFPDGRISRTRIDVCASECLTLSTEYERGKVVLLEQETRQ